MAAQQVASANAGSSPHRDPDAGGPAWLRVRLGVSGNMIGEHLKGMRPATFVSLNVALATVIILALVRIPRSATVTTTQFFLMCAGTFMLFLVLSLLAKLRVVKALLWAAICSALTIFAAAGIAAYVHEVLRL
jgi:hypothetical protein